MRDFSHPLSGRLNPCMPRLRLLEPTISLEWILSARSDVIEQCCKFPPLSCFTLRAAWGYAAALYEPFDTSADQMDDTTQPPLLWSTEWQEYSVLDGHTNDCEMSTDDECCEAGSAWLDPWVAGASMAACRGIAAW